MRRISFFVFLVFVISAFADSAAQKIRKGEREFNRGNIAKAERLFREATALDPNSVEAHLFLGHVLYFQRRYSAAIDPYEKARQLDAAKKTLKRPDRLALLNQLGVAYFFNMERQKAKRVFETGIKEEPDYPILYYQLACVYSETDDLDNALAQLKEAWKRREHLLPGEKFPDPRQDDSFKKYWHDPRFKEVVNEMVF
jgi:Tfp pilus assembly protein PilF